MTPADRDAFLAFFRAAAALEDRLRSGFTPAGRPESTAEHTWRLCLIAIALDDALGVDLRRLPAPLQGADRIGDRTADERAALAGLRAPLDAATARRAGGG